MAPPLPPSMQAQVVTKADGSKTQVVNKADAERLMGVSKTVINGWIQRGKVAICLDADNKQWVFVDSLWAQVPREFQRG